MLYVGVAEKLQAFLQFLEEQSMPWKWKVHCKTQKKLKELSRLVPLAEPSDTLHYSTIILEGGLLFTIICWSVNEGTLV